jgi:hypothetical protein
LLGIDPTPEEEDEDEDEDEEELALWVEDFDGVGAAAAGVVAVVAVPAPGEVTLITWAGVVVALPASEPERPIRTPMPIASSSTPTLAITAVGPPERGTATGAAKAPTGALATEGSSIAVETPGEAAPPPDTEAPSGRRRSSRTLPRWARPAPHSRQ